MGLKEKALAAKTLKEEEESKAKEVDNSVPTVKTEQKSETKKKSCFVFVPGYQCASDEKYDDYEEEKAKEEEKKRKAKEEAERKAKEMAELAEAARIAKEKEEAELRANEEAELKER